MPIIILLCNPIMSISLLPQKADKIEQALENCALLSQEDYEKLLSSHTAPIYLRCQNNFVFLAKPSPDCGKG